jgi:hypothetical protein
MTRATPEYVAERLERQRDKVQRERDRHVALVAGIHLRRV